jgi:hypothetical protein
MTDEQFEAILAILTEVRDELRALHKRWGG